MAAKIPAKTCCISGAKNGIFQWQVPQQKESDVTLLLRVPESHTIIVNYHEALTDTLK